MPLTTLEHGTPRGALPERVLVVRLGAIGDVVNALVFAAALREARADVHIGWVVHPLAEPLVSAHPCVQRVHVWRRGGGPHEFLRLVRELRAARYELAVDLQRLQKSALLARLSGAPRVLGYDRARTKEASWLWTNERVAPSAGPRHMVERYLEVARHLGCPAGVPRFLWARDEGAERWAEELVATLGAAPVLVNLGASKPANRWAPARFAELVQSLVGELGVPVCLAGGPDDRARVVPGFLAPGVRDLVGRTSLPQLAALARRARLFVGCDTGPMHLAAAAGTPVVALFGPADPLRTGPYELVPGRHRVVRTLPACAPCNRKTCNQPRHACMEDLTPALVLAAVRASLAERPQPSGSVG